MRSEVAGARFDPRRELGYAAEVFAVCGFAVVQPLLDVFGRAPEQFVFRGAGAADVVLFGVAVTFVPALVAWAASAALGVTLPRLRPALHLGLVAVLVGALAVQALRSLLDGGLPLFAAAAAIGAAAGIARARWPAVRLWLRYAAPAPLLFLALFLLASTTARLLVADDAGAAAAAAGIANPVPVVMVVLDEFPLNAVLRTDGTIDRDLFPNLAALADDAHWYRDAASVSTSTWHAVPALVTGRMPTDAAPIAADHPDNLFTLLGEGYDLDVTESYTRLCPERLCRLPADVADPGALLGDAWRVLQTRLSWSGEQRDPVAGLGEDPFAVAGDAAADGLGVFERNQPARFRALVEGIADDTRPTLHYLHLLLPHVPYRYLPSGLRYDGPDPDLGRRGDVWVDDQALVDLGRQRLLLQVAYVDALVGELVAALREAGVYDDALVVLVGDHGISFRAGGPIRALRGQQLDPPAAADLLWVPLIVKLPNQEEGVVSDAEVSSLDVLPTIADVLGVDLPWEVDGRSLLGPPRPAGTRPFVPSDTGGEFGVAPLDPVAVDTLATFADVLATGVDGFAPGGSGAAVTGVDRLFRVGPRPELVGTDAAVLPPVPFSVLAGTDLDVDPASGEIPALLRGNVDAPPGTPIAVAVNGRVAATVVTHAGEGGGDGDGDGGSRFAAVVADHVFRPGPNDVTVHLADR